MTRRSSADRGAFVRRRGPVVLAACLFSALALTDEARALDVEVDADTSFVAYEVRTPSAVAFLARRRLTMNLGLRLVQTFGEPDAAGRIVRVSVAGRLRLDQGFGEDCLVGRDLCVRATDRNDLSAFQPLATNTGLDLPMLWARVDGLPLGITARLGRQTLFDAIGFARFDGAQLGFAPATWIAIDAAAGALVRRTTFAGSPAFEPGGSIRLDLGDLDPSRVPWVDPPRTTWLAGGSVRGGPGSYLQLGAAFRQLWDDDGAIVLRRLGFTATSDLGELVRLEGIAVVDLLDGTVITALGAAEVHEGRFSMRLAYDRQVPRFDPGSIWAWFSTAPIDQLRLSGSYRITDDLELGAGLRGRRAELGGGYGDDLDVGIEGFARARVERVRLSAAGFAWSGALGPVSGVSLDVARPIIPELALEAHLSVWQFDDPNQQGAYGTVVSQSLVGVATITPQASILVELSHANNRVVGDRFRGLVTLSVETWR